MIFSKITNTISNKCTQMSKSRSHYSTHLKFQVERLAEGLEKTSKMKTTISNLLWQTALLKTRTELFKMGNLP